MPLRFIMAQATASDQRPIDWQAAFRLIERIEFKDLLGDQVSWHWEEAEYPGSDNDDLLDPNPQGTYRIVRDMRNLLWGDLEDLQAVIAHGDRVMVEVRVAGHRVFVVGTFAGVDDPDPLYGIIGRLAEVCALAAAGFVAASPHEFDCTSLRYDFSGPQRPLRTPTSPERALARRRAGVVVRRGRCGQAST